MLKFFALLMIASLLGLPVAAPLARANEDRLGEPGSEMEQLRVLQILDEISTGERVGRYVGSSVRSALGAALITGGALATDSPTRVLLLLSGGVVTIYGIKGFFVPTPIENFAELYRSRPSGGFDDGALYFIRKTARENRLWDSALSLAAGAVTVTGGAFSSSQFVSIFSYVSGGLLVLSGVAGLIFRSSDERAIDRFETERKRPILKPVAFGPMFTAQSAELGLTLQY